MYRPNSICSHALVVAEKCGDLDSFLKWRVSQAKSYNFTSLATVNINTKSSRRKGNRQRRDRSQKKNQCGDASDNLGIENRQHVRPQPSVCGSTLPSQDITGSTATDVPIVNDARHTLGILGAGGQPIQTLEEDEYLHSTFSRKFGTQNQPHSYPGSLMDQTTPFPSTQETRNTHTLDMPYFADNPCSFQQQTMEAPNHTRLLDSLAVLSTMMLGSYARGLMTSDVPVQSSKTGYLQQIMPRALVPRQGCIHPGGSPNRSQPPAVRKPWHNSNPFTIMKINRRISRCTGCRGSLPKNPDNSPCPPPLDFVVQHVEKDEYPYKDPLTGAVQNRISGEKPKYYHPMPSCILQRHPYFKESMLRFQEGMIFDFQHEQYLASVFGISV